MTHAHSRGYVSNLKCDYRGGEEGEGGGEVVLRGSGAAADIRIANTWMAK